MARTSRRRLVTVAVLAAVLAGVAAYAVWRSVGAGAGSGASTTAATLTLGPGTPAARLYPGSTTAVVVAVSNPGTADVRVGSLALAPVEGDGGFDTDDGHAGCGVGALTFTTQTNGGAGWTVPAGGSLPISLPSSLTMAADADAACQGATFTVHLRVAG